MSPNQRYIAFTRALDDLYIYPEEIDISEYLKKATSKNGEGKSAGGGCESQAGEPKHKKRERVIHTDSVVRRFFEEKGFNVVDKRDSGGRLWVIGEKDLIRGMK